jgi:hypothetical protein
LAHLIAGPKIELKGTGFGPKPGSTLSLSAQNTGKQKISSKLKFEPKIRPNS